MTEVSDEGAYDVLCMSHLRWDWVYQRPQHLMSLCARERRVFFVEEPVYDAREPGMTSAVREGEVHVVVPHLREEDRACSAPVLEALLKAYIRDHRIDRYVLWYYTPMALDCTRDLEPVAVVYDCMDELSAFAQAPPELPARDVELLRRADLVFTGGQSLYEAKRTQHPSVHAFPSGVDLKHFARARGRVDVPPDQQSIPSPRLGYYGVLDERLDLELLAGVAAARPQWQIVMVGPVTKIDEAVLPRAANIHYLGLKTYDELPNYVAGWDIAILPFVCDDTTRFISPTKTPEYLAAGKPVISTSIQDVVRPYGALGLVSVADTVDEWIAAAEAVLVEERDQIAIDTYLRENSWDRTWNSMRDMIDGLIAYRETEEEAGSTESVEVIRSCGGPTFDYLIVGAGFAGSVLAERLASQAGKRVLVVDRRPHIGGNAYDRYDEAGILIHQYGPHIFHTNAARVMDYLSQFTAWRPYQHRVRAAVDGQLLPIPINLDTVNQLYGLHLSSFELEAFFESVAEPRAEIRTAEDVVVSRVGRDLYETFFRGYTRKQWGLDPAQLDASVTARVPTRTSRDDRYFTDTYQSMPLHGYTRLFERLLDHPNISLLLQTDYREIEDLIPYRAMVYTGPIDEFFGFRYGKLPYRSLQFRFETLDVAQAQPYPVINYPTAEAYTRVTELKYLTGQEHRKTTVVYEYPQEEGDPYYPIPTPENAARYAQYKALAQTRPEVTFVGRLATYKYYNMDQVVAQALAAFDRMVRRDPLPAPDLVVEHRRSVEASPPVGGDIDRTAAAR